MTTTRPAVDRSWARASGEPMTLRMWGFPWLTWAVLAGLAALAVLMLTDAAARAQLLSTAGLVVVILALYALTHRGRARRVGSAEARRDA